MYNYKESVICTLIKAKYVTKFNLSISAVVNEYHDQRYVYGIDVDENIISNVHGAARLNNGLHFIGGFSNLVYSGNTVTYVVLQS